ncbi:LANO_0H23310g1_1 [Lachancea nothofagi CBS 11611]|uniref:type II protein arginine methyltransferase n=1 Tax=Lachancea nothofagi CBS 11611 TaxID=1266666 RepID=A0A1G4KNL8_9SACH|nr:LANO_0H23310g1_1 [Lachancea nothofagi CBS 11611]
MIPFRITKRALTRQYHSLPLLDTNELVLKGIPTEGTVAGRDYMEWASIRELGNRNFFAPRSRAQRQLLPSISQYEEILAHCMARWLLVDYKLNSFPYFDLNIVTVYTDLHQSLRMSRSILNYYAKTVPEDLYQRVNCYLLPLHNNNVQENMKVSVPDSKITVLQDGILSTSPSFFIEDPVYVIMANDVLRHLSQDYVRRVDSTWEQRYLDFYEQGTRHQRFSKTLDYWCNVTLDTLASELDASGLQETYIPTRLVQLFYLLQHCAPEHKLLAFDAAQGSESLSVMRQVHSWFSPQKETFRASQPYGPQDPLNSDEATSFVSNFTELRKIYAAVGNGAKVCQSKSLDDFARDWSDIEETECILGVSDLGTRTQWMRDASIGVLHA